MANKGKSKIYKHPKAATLYVTIPSDIVKDSTFPFKEGDIVSVEIIENAKTDTKAILIQKLKEGEN